MSESKQYRIETLMDVFENVPKDRIKLCMEELADGLINARDFQEFQDSLTDAPTGHCVFPGYFTWIDDNLGERTTNFNLNGKKVAEIKTYSTDENDGL